MNEKALTGFHKNQLFCQTLNTPLGKMFVEASSYGLTQVGWGENEHSEIVNIHTQKGVLWLNRYFEKNDTEMLVFDTRSLTIFQKSVLLKLNTSKLGSVMSYGELASKVNSSGASRAVGSVMAMNPWPIIVPCHRVVRSDGIIGNYSGVGGKTTKEWLLSHERIEYEN